MNRDISPQLMLVFEDEFSDYEIWSYWHNQLDVLDELFANDHRYDPEYTITKARVHAYDAMLMLLEEVADIKLDL